MVTVELAAGPSPVTRFPLGVLAGVVATFGMDLAMRRLPEGLTPPRVAASVLTERPVDRAPGRLASTVHYVAGWLTGPLFVWLLFASEAVVGGPSVLATVLATAVLFALMVAFFIGVVLPRARLPRQRVEQTARDWAVSAGAYLAVLVPVVAVGTLLL